MTRFLLALMAFGMLGAAPQAAACRWFGTQLECDLGWSQMVVGTQTAAEPAYAGALKPTPLQESHGLLGDRAVTEWPLRLELQNAGPYPNMCRKFGSESDCY